MRPGEGEDLRPLQVRPARAVIALAASFWGGTSRASRGLARPVDEAK